MPLRLAFCPPLGIAPTNHTSDNIHFEVLDKNGEEEHVLYRWLGGIYCDRKETNDPNTKYRVYWTDSGLGEKKDTIRMYDPFLLDGRIIGDIKPAPDGSLIPAKWWPPVLFYERVLNPDSMDIVVASGVLGDIGYAVQNEIVITQHHEPWASRRPALASTNGDAVQNYVEQGQIGEAEIGGIEFDKEFARFTNIQNQRYERETAPSPSLYSNDGHFTSQIHDPTPETLISQSIPDSTLANYPNVLRIVELDGYDNIPDFNANARDGLQSGTFEAGVCSSDGQPNNYPFLEAFFTDDVNRMEEDLRLIGESEADVQTSSVIPSGAGETNNTGDIGQNVRHYNEQNNVTVAPQDLGRDQFQAHVRGMESNVNIVPQGQRFQTIMRHRPFQGGDFLVPSIEIDFQETAAFNMKGTFPASSFYNRAQYESSVLPPGRNENQHQHHGSSFPSSGFSENITSASGKSFPTLAPSPDVYPHFAMMPYPRAPSSAAMLPAELAVVPKKRKSSISNLQQYGQAFQPKKANLGDFGQ
ncbi:hypothetical protein BGW36DRAFT_368790 [Talaromyces proteolyticus]|uniref:Uncharacterized protein n=1 Tax=Talaromyces proteolyticus TaxID=1131652 RepID=A0AAD4L061_9EURO|nr:uncharacterized protein BGW36DRAFT_368790 [Talaromyces proteolyticus]KAH8703080.1 hypothetical protein BGW36DRAFT_368790 [Talaromyces proteolyticus]